MKIVPDKTLLFYFDCKQQFRRMERQMTTMAGNKREAHKPEVGAPISKNSRALIDALKMYHMELHPRSKVPSEYSHILSHGISVDLDLRRGIVCREATLAYTTACIIIYRYLYLNLIIKTTYK